MPELQTTPRRNSPPHQTAGGREVSQADPPLIKLPQLAVGDCFEKQGRRVIKWQVESMVQLPRVGLIITMAELGGTARVRVNASDIFGMGFNRISSTPQH
jgi:hypothetical protein